MNLIDKIFKLFKKSSLLKRASKKNQVEADPMTIAGALFLLKWYSTCISGLVKEDETGTLKGVSEKCLRVLFYTEGKYFQTDGYLLIPWVIMLSKILKLTCDAWSAQRHGDLIVENSQLTKEQSQEVLSRYLDLAIFKCNDLLKGITDREWGHYIRQLRYLIYDRKVLDDLELSQSILRGSGQSLDADRINRIISDLKKADETYKHIRIRI